MFINFFIIFSLPIYNIIIILATVLFYWTRRISFIWRLLNSIVSIDYWLYCQFCNDNKLWNSPRNSTTSTTNRTRGKEQCIISLSHSLSHSLSRSLTLDISHTAPKNCRNIA